MFFGPEKRARLDPLDGAHIVPDLAVEVLSRSTEARDRGRKMAPSRGRAEALRYN